MPTQAMRTSQMLAIAVMSMLVVLGVVVGLSVPEADLTLPSAYVIGGQVAAGVVIFVLCSTVGFRAEPITPGTDPEQAMKEGLQRQQSSMFLRLVLSELVAIVSLALAFVLTEGQLMTYVIGALISLALMAFYVYPSARNIRRVEERLDSAGAQSRLADAFGVGARFE